jgi:hypothetical protein
MIVSLMLERREMFAQRAGGSGLNRAAPKQEIQPLSTRGERA